jgi:ankyrin repeat protein
VLRRSPLLMCRVAGRFGWFPPVAASSFPPPPPPARLSSVGNADVLPALVADPECAAQVQCVDYLGRSPLYLAVQAGHHDTARMLVRLGANLEWRDVNGLSALVIAAFNGDVDMCEQLLEDGARPLAKVRVLSRAGSVCCFGV